MDKQAIAKGVGLAFFFMTQCAVLSAWASGPHPATITGCALGGKLFSTLTDLGSYTHEWGYWIRPVNKDLQPISLRRHEGKMIKVRGQLLPGDRFIVDPGDIQILKPCDPKLRKSLSKEVAQNLRAEGETLEKEGKLEEALDKYQQGLKYSPRDQALKKKVKELQKELSVSRPSANP